MPNQYSPKRFFRETPNHFLKQYFSQHQVLTEINFEELSEAKIDPLFEAWRVLPERTRNEMEQDFQEINGLATEGGTKAILDEANFHGEDLAEQFSTLKGFHEHAFWTFLKRPKYWRGATAFHHSDNVPASYWRKRKNLPSQPAHVDSESIAQFEKALSGYFHKTQGRGQNCKVDCYKRNDLDYFFAYPEDYAQASLEWDDKEFKRRPHHPAFEIIFVYSQADQTLDIYLPGQRKPITDLQSIFASTILKAEIGPDEKDERIYDLSPLSSRHFEFVYGIESGISDVSIKKLRLSIRGTNERVILEASPTQDKHSIFDLLEKITKGISLSQISVTQVGLKVSFTPNPLSRRKNTRSVNISWPNSCSLKHDGQDLIIRQMLADSGIEPRILTQKDEAAA